ncbi:MAG: hypothetical protein GX335_01870 [Firmicutes bacterium]|nr:hypothetical protein [Bacillota bacterium]
MPKDKKKKRQPSRQSSQAGLGSANTFFETAEELANRHSESKERGKGEQSKKAQGVTPDPENPENRG